MIFMIIHRVNTWISSLTSKASQLVELSRIVSSNFNFLTSLILNFFLLQIFSKRYKKISIINCQTVSVIVDCSV